MQREKNTTTEHQRLEERGAFKGPIRVPLHSLLFLFNNLALPSISSKSFRFQSVLFSIPTARTKQFFTNNNKRFVEAAGSGRSCAASEEMKDEHDEAHDEQEMDEP